MHDKLNDLKAKFEKETGFDVTQYENMNKGELTSRQNGYIGGYIGGSMTKKLVEMAERQIDEN
jgi:hypothetical protein